MANLVSDPAQALAGIRRLNRSLDAYPDLAARLGQAHAFYVDYHDSGEPLFGFSKFVGHADLTPETYLSEYRELNGRNTEHALAPWFDEVSPGSMVYADLYRKLTDWMGQYGKKPRGGKAQHLRIMVIRPEFRPQPPGGSDRDLLDLMIKVAAMLPTHQRQELRAAI